MKDRMLSNQDRGILLGACCSIKASNIEYQEWLFSVPVWRLGTSLKYMDETMDDRPHAMYVLTPLRAALKET